MRNNLSFSIMKPIDANVTVVMRPLLKQFESIKRYKVDLQALEWSDGLEKLIRLLREDIVLGYYPYSKIQTEINFKGFKKGMYWLEAEDLASHQVKYARVEVR